MDISLQNMTEVKAPGQVIFLQNVGPQRKILSANLIGQPAVRISDMFERVTTTTTTTTATTMTTSRPSMDTPQVNHHQTHDTAGNQEVHGKQDNGVADEGLYSQVRPQFIPIYHTLYLKPFLRSLSEVYYNSWFQ